MFSKTRRLEKTEIFEKSQSGVLVREYQKEALGRFLLLLRRISPKAQANSPNVQYGDWFGKNAHYGGEYFVFLPKGYRNFIFFTRLGNIIQKTKANFLDPNSKKYLFADKITLGGQEIKIKEVDNFEGVNDDDINIIFSTTALLHSRFNFARENVLTYEDFADKKIVLIADEAHKLIGGNKQQIKQDRRRRPPKLGKYSNADFERQQPKG